MTIRPIPPEEKKAYNEVVSHPLQTYEWGEFREKTGLKVIRRGVYEGEKLVAGFSLTIHKIPKTSWTIGYLPKGDFPNDALIGELKKIGKEEKCIFIQLEPNIIAGKNEKTMADFGLKSAAHPLFTKYTFVLDLTKSEEEILKNMHSKTRYNIRVAQRHDVQIVEDNSRTAFESYWQLSEETTNRQKFFAHSKLYHTLQWDLLNVSKKRKDNALTSHLFLAKYNDKVLTAWLLFVFKDTLYYPYGASSTQHREVMASNLMMWEVIKFGKNKGLKQFDMWGALGPNPDTKDPWYGFHSFKEKYSPAAVEFIGSYDLVINPMLYEGFKVANKLRWLLLRLKK
jgi:lipid II:glycine glycyltransferase (peptidoglycan interpeptide bridge formation enzyme)